MNNNDYKNAIDQIKASEKLKKDTIYKINQKKQKTNQRIFLKVATVCTLLIVASVAYLNFDNKETITNVNNENIKISKKIDLPKIKNKEELIGYLEKNKPNYVISDTVETDSIIKSSPTMGESNQLESEVQDKNIEYSTTNVQEKNVDEADIVKTDGNYIYYLSNSYKKGNSLIIVDVEKSKVVNKINYEKEIDEEFDTQEMYLYNNKLVVIGIIFKYNTEDYYTNSTITTALVYDISDREDIKLERTVDLSGAYVDSRMINGNIYLISNKSIYYYDGIKEREIVPCYTDTCKGNDESIQVKYDDIYYFPDSTDNNYLMIAGFNVANNEEANIQTFLGSGSTVYASQNNLYITRADLYERYTNKNIIIGNRNYTEIYKFELKDGVIEYKATGKIDGAINDQFSIDEYEGNLRVATTVYTNDDRNKTNTLYILNEDLKQISSIDNMADGEKIYSVRFIGKTGYIVTFKQVDPLFVIDLSNPENPEIKGQLKIPGYSSYLHPYDETHIIGIGKNTEETLYGSTVSTNMKMSMFDISDLENPKELFNISIGKKGTNSPILDNHKALLYSKDKNIIGFPITIYNESYNYSKSESGAIVYDINLEKEFTEKGFISVDKSDRNNYDKTIQRIIYIGNKYYTISNSEIIITDMETFEEVGRIEF